MKILKQLRIIPEAYHPEASKFRYNVLKQAGVYQPTNQEHECIFCPNMEGFITNKMASARKETVKKLSRAKINSISLAGRTLSEEVVVERIFREARANFGFFF